MIAILAIVRSYIINVTPVLCHMSLMFLDTKNENYT